MRTTERLEVRPLTRDIGAEVLGVDLSGDLSDETIRALRDALLLYHVLFFPEQELDHEQHTAFARRFGPLAPSHPVLLAPLDGQHPEVYALSTRDGGGKVPRWHADVTYMPTPPSISIMRIVELPRTGGDTLFASTEAAYDHLSPAFQRLCDGLHATHDSAGWGQDVFRELLAQGRTGEWDDEAVTELVPVVHPVVRVHPETGRRGLYVDPAATISIVELSAEESEWMLRLLTAHTIRVEHTVRYRWSEGDVGMWDQRCTLHYAVDDYGDAARSIERVSVRGDRPFGPAEAVSTASSATVLA
jgi:taurine dioxygenase